MVVFQKSHSCKRNLLLTSSRLLLFVICLLLILLFAGQLLHYDIHHLWKGGESKAVCETEACKKSAKRMLEYMDAAVRPCDNFYRFACGRFLDTAEIQDAKTQNSSFTQIDDKMEEQLKTIVFEKPKSGEPLPYYNMKLLFSLCMDEDKIDARGVDHALKQMQVAGGWPVLGGWREEGWNFLDMEIFLRNLSIGGGSLFSISVSVDAKNTTRHVIEVDQASLGLPREFLIKGIDDPIVQAYYSYMVDIAVMFGADRQTAMDQLKQSLLFEIELANISVPREDRRDFQRMYNPYELTELMAQIGWVDWARLLSSMMPKPISLSKNELIIVNEVGFLKKLENLLRNYSPKVIANHMMWHAASGLSGILTNEMRNRHLEFSKAVIGTKAREPRWKECIEVASSLSLALSSMYVKKFFDETSKKEALDMTEKIRLEITRDILELDWMDEETRKRAEFKASKVVQHIGYPDELVDIRKIEHHYEGMVLNKEHYFEALIDLLKWSKAYKFRQLREPVNKTDWRTHGDVAVVNAYYNPIENSMQFPAGILQQPFFNAHVPKYINYASIGFVVGHEITHGFDDQGSQFDYNGDLKEWWEDKSKVSFVEKKKCMIDQYADFKDNQTQLNLNGITTQGENVADNGGLKLAYRAYQRLAEELDEPEPLLPGLHKFNQNQLFFLSMANIWCTRYRTEALKYQITTGVHSPAEFRVNGVLKNLPQFSKVFQCGVDDPMNPEKKCAVW